MRREPSEKSVFGAWFVALRAVAAVEDCFQDFAIPGKTCCHLFFGEEGNPACWDGAEYTYRKCCMEEGRPVNYPLIEWWRFQEVQHGLYVNATVTMTGPSTDYFVREDAHWLFPVCNALSFALSDLLDLSFCLAMFAGARYSVALHEWRDFMTVPLPNARMACERMKGLSPDTMPAYLHGTLDRFNSTIKPSMNWLSNAPVNAASHLEGLTLLELAHEIQYNVSSLIHDLAFQLGNLPWQQDEAQFLVPVKTASHVRALLKEVSQEQVYRMLVMARFADGRLGTGKVSSAKFHLGIGTVRWEILSHLISSLPEVGEVRMAEIGVCHAPVPLFLLNAHTNLHWTGVDVDPKAKETVTANLAEYIQKGRVNFLLGSSHEVIVEGPLDLVFIDGDHEEDAVHLDLQAWVPRVRSGGIVAGHDYGYLGVIKAVNDYLPKGKTLHLSTDHVWWFVAD
eukprot:TRINITY_DN111675_c0_g1_i1.p1 TRINITY_DN111675_c0_g1~~TRINITY_DN111675_c0_g1_i1.p1  ORF type:complete len:452 (-),score=61.71 TRINITY_DN111675_c0_g1_i1:235-1590(-)